VIGSNPNWFQQELERRIVADQTNRCTSLGQGIAGDFADYRYGVGFIAGLETALDISKEIMKELEQ
jgi:hypothetical protein